jgi:hypothetical protein
MSPGDELVNLVRELIQAENERDGKKADRVLAPGFAAITRSRGEEQDREALLREIANPKNADLHRRLDERSCWVRHSGELGVVRSLVETGPRATPFAVTDIFRNTHVFERQAERWRCIAWQVTKMTFV